MADKIYGSFSVGDYVSAPGHFGGWQAGIVIPPEGMAASYTKPNEVWVRGMHGHTGWTHSDMLLRITKEEYEQAELLYHMSE